MAKQRLLETQEELSAEVAEKANKVHELAEEIGAKLAKAEQLGADGFVEESIKLMAEVRLTKNHVTFGGAPLKIGRAEVSARGVQFHRKEIGKKCLGLDATFLLLLVRICNLASLLTNF